ncbi:acyltransferase-domain-containing protein, partial [Patellaria atrata CBS 101060]
MPRRDFGEGINLNSGSVGDDDDHPSGPPKHGEMSQAERAFSFASTFMSGILAINASQFMGLPLKLINEEYYDTYVAFTKQSFGVLITTMTQWWAPTVVRVSGDKSMKGQLIQEKDGSLRCAFPNRLVLMANHQLYTDWLYLWWIAYTNSMHGRIYIILKESLRKIPFVGWGAQAYNFIFLSRKWKNDKSTFQRHLAKLSNPKDPMWLLIFPEGTNLAAGTRAASKKWADENGLEDMKHQLLPRSTGLQFCLQELRQSTEWLYDCTIAYEGVPPGKFGQDIFTLRSSFFEGRPPKSVNMHWRRFSISSIPLDNPKAFEVWLRNRWREKDHLLEIFTHTGRFPSEEPLSLKEDMNGNGNGAPGKIRMAKYIETQVKSRSWEEFLSIFAPLSCFVIVLFFFYGAS